MDTGTNYSLVRRSTALPVTGTTGSTKRLAVLLEVTGTAGTSSTALVPRLEG
jgi:hypothetical protein